MFSIKREVTFRQILCLVLFLSLSPLLRQVPSALVDAAGNTAYLSTIFALLPLIPLVGIIILFLQSYPGKNIYEILEHLVGEIFAKIVIFFYMIWALTMIVVIMNQYALTLQSTLMPYTKTNYFVLIMLVLSFYAVHKGMKTIFRISELILAPILILLAVLLVFGLSKFKVAYLLPISTESLVVNLIASKNVYTIAGNIIIILFFADNIKNFIQHKKQNKIRLWGSMLVFTITAAIITLSTLAINGPSLSARLPYAFFMTAKRIAAFRVFERFEAFITLFCVLSDFIAISIFIVIVIRCIKWIFALDHIAYLEIPLAMLVYYLTFYLSSTQFELYSFYNTICIPMNLIMQYLCPLFMVVIFYGKKLKN